MRRFCQFVLLFFLLLSFSFPSVANGPVPSDTSNAASSARYTIYPSNPSTKQHRQPSYRTQTKQSTQRYHTSTQRTQAQSKQPHHHHATARNTQPKRAQLPSGREVIQSHRNVPHFSAISVSGDLDVTVTSGTKESVVLRGEAATVQKISTTVSNGILYIKGSRHGRNVNTTIHVTADSSLSALYATRSARITARHIRSRGLVVHMDGSSRVNVQGGGVVLRGVENNSTQNFVMSGIHSRSIHLAGKGPGGFTLSGTTENLTARLCGGMQLNAEHLEANNIYVRTEDHSVAVVTPIQALYVFAFHNSNVYYCKTPVKLVIRTEESGNVLKVP